MLQHMSLTNSYLNVLSEGSSGVVSGNIKPGTDVIDGYKEGHGGPCECDDVETPTKGLSVSDKDGKPKEAKDSKGLAKESDLFTSIYNKILSEEENWEELADKEDQEGDELSFSGDMDSGEGEVDLGGGEGEEEEAAEVGGMEEVLDALKAAVAALERVLGQEQGEDEIEEGEDEEDLGGEMDDLGDAGEAGDEGGPEGEEGDTIEDEVDAEVLGHSLIDLDKLAASLTSPKSQVVKGAVPVTKGKAQVPKGAKVDGKLSELSGDPEDLENKKKQDVGGVKQGKTVFEQ
jgi:hypothetical protein